MGHTCGPCCHFVCWRDTFCPCPVRVQDTASCPLRGLIAQSDDDGKSGFLRLVAQLHRSFSVVLRGGIGQTWRKPSPDILTQTANL